MDGILTQSKQNNSVCEGCRKESRESNLQESQRDNA